MPQTNETILQKIQAGKEITRGTAVAATRIVPAQGTLSYNKPLVALPEQSGTFASRRTAVSGRPEVGFTTTMGASYEHLPWFFLHALKGGVTAVSDAGTPPAYPYTFTPNQTADDLLSSTFELGEPGNVYKSTQCMVNSWTIRGDGDSTDEPAWMVEAEWLARDLANSTYTASLAAITAEAVMAPGTLVYIDAAGGTPGTTQVVGRVINFSITGNNNIHLKGYLEDETGFGAGALGRGERTFDAQITVEFKDDTEFANYRASTPVERIIMLRRLGTQIHGTTVVKKTAELTIAGYWSSWSPGDRDGNMTATFGLMGFVDNTLAYDFSAKVINALAVIA